MNVRTQPKQGRYWEIHPYRPRDFHWPCLGLNPQKISRASGLDFPNTSLVFVVHWYNTIPREQGPIQSLGPRESMIPGSSSSSSSSFMIIGDCQVKYGEEAWENVRKMANIDTPTFSIHQVCRWRDHDCEDEHHCDDVDVDEEDGKHWHIHLLQSHAVKLATSLLLVSNGKQTDT